MFKLYRVDLKDEATWKAALQSISDGLTIFETELVKRGTTFYGGFIYYINYILSYS